MRDSLADLNIQQRQVVTTTKGPVLVLAGAGSGKTRALTHRIAYLLQQKQATPRQIMAVTFTNKAARQMRERVGALVGSQQQMPSAIGTFHGLGARILRQQAACHARSEHFVIMDTKDSERLIRQALRENKLSAREWKPAMLRHRISEAKHALQSPDMMNERQESFSDEVVAKVYRRYETLLAQHDAYDFDDFLAVPLTILQQESHVRSFYQNLWRYVSVDEYQDTNALQDQFLHLILHPKERNICVVGDDYQAIYSWRGARVEHILCFEQTYPDCTTIYLTQN
ncbi:MAG: ATP-dependent helicase, partial [Acidobacteriota bacterium]